MLCDSCHDWWNCYNGLTLNHSWKKPLHLSLIVRYQGSLYCINLYWSEKFWAVKNYENISKKNSRTLKNID